MGQSDSKEQEQPRPQSVRRRESRRSVNNGQSHASAPPLVPTSSASGGTSTTPVNAHAQRSTSSHSKRSAATTPGLHLTDSISSQKSNTSMGNAESRPRPSSRSATRSASSSKKEKPTPSPAAKPVEITQTHDGPDDKEVFEPPRAPLTEAAFESSRWDPPRLPLPIEEEEHMPGSPLLSGGIGDVVSPIDLNQMDSPLPRRSSVLSSTTLDEEEVTEQDIVAAEQHSALPTVPTTLTWRGHGDKIYNKVYVTGTFVNWERKFKLHRDKENGVFTTTLPLKPGTHHLKFLVGGDMITSEDLPTTVDWTNILVNYIEVVAPMPSETEQQPPAPAEPMPIPGAAMAAGQSAGTSEPVALDIREEAQVAGTEPELSSTLPDNVVPVVKPSSAVPIRNAQSTPSSSVPAPHAPTPATVPARQRLPRAQYTNQIPAFFLGLDASNAEDDRYQRAKRVEQYLPQPPSLPLFLGKSILNANTPHKDDASVLTMPNHTVINHLATSSIKNGVLATSGTTRYKRKFLTTIMHKPTSEEG